MAGKGGVIKSQVKKVRTPAIKVVQTLAYSMEELAKAVGVSRSYLYQEMKRGRLHAIKVGARTLVTIEQARAWLALWEAAS